MTDESEAKYITWREGVSRIGRSTMFVKCPFCKVETEVYKWSFGGCGKRCQCGVKLSMWGCKR